MFLLPGDTSVQLCQIYSINNGLTDSATRRHLDSATLEIQDLHEYCKTGSDTFVHFLLIFS